ncbi:sensor protein KdpD [Anaerotignum neopropionicum]|uniref:histidine kinase n=1 Tax=Anaerotignum neopropionicum TaxID=36847 RepID=A0A136WD76_9FIRM|nr:ATP-binding protein [Anaerotignum neopropionicum]KXL52463.1 sensor protein KdpD [Anaerotignum neopropionicum]
MRDYLRQLKKIRLSPDIILFDLFKTILVFLIATSFALCVVEMNVISNNIFGVYMLGVALTSVITSGFIWGILASIGGVIAVNFFFTFPYFALNFSMAGYPITFALLLIMSVLTSALTTRVKKAAILSAMRESRAENLTKMSNALLSGNTLHKIMEITVDFFSQSNQCSVVTYLGNPASPEIKLIKALQNQDESIFNSPLELQIAIDAYVKNKIRGVVLEAKVQNCKGTYIPISTDNKVYGVIGLLFENADFVLSDTFQFSRIMISQTILALERQAVEEKAQQILLEQEKEKMRSNLLRAVSHDLRTPLTCILGASTTLLENKDKINEEKFDCLLNDIHHDAQWLIHMVENLLSITKISSEDAKVKKQEEIVEEIVSESVSRIHKRFPDATIYVSVPDEILMVPMDATLIEQVLINLLENAIRHSETSLPVWLKVSRENDEAVFCVTDYGKGIDPSSLPTIFEGKSSTVSADSSRGLGIGLSICKTIILAHNGKISAANHVCGGATFTFVLPMKGEF